MDSRKESGWSCEKRCAGYSFMVDMSIVELNGEKWFETLIRWDLMLC